jgi:hypothetical protein
MSVVCCWFVVNGNYVEVISHALQQYKISFAIRQFTTCVDRFRIIRVKHRRHFVCPDLVTYFYNESTSLDTIYVYLRHIEGFRN